MRLLAVSHNYPRLSATGAGLFIHRLHCGLREHGVEVHVLQLADWAPPWPLAALLADWRRFRAERRDMLPRLDGIPIHHPETFWPRPSRLFSPDGWARQVRALVAYCRKRRELARPDAVLGHFLVPDGYHALGLARALGVPAIAMAWGDDVHAWPERSAYWRDRLRVVLAGADALIACSRRLAADGDGWLERPRGDWDVVYAGVDLDVFHPTSDPVAHRPRVLPQLPQLFSPDTKVMLMIAQPVVAKGYLEMLDAWSAVAPAAQGWHLVIAGANWANVDVESEARARGIAHCTHWIGAQPASVIPELLRASDAFVLPSHNEGLSLALLEAMATGLPIVTTDVGGHAEVLRDGRDAWFVPPRDARALARALREVVSSPAERRRRGALARQAGERVGTPRENAGRLAEVIGRVTRSAVGAQARCSLRVAGGHRAAPAVGGGST